MAGPKVACITALDPEQYHLVASQALPGMDVVYGSTAISDGEKIEMVKDADFIILWPGRLSDRVLQAAARCRLVQLLSAGYDQMNLRLALDLGIPVANNGGANSVAVAEHTIMLILACYRNLIYHANRVKGGEWRPTEDRNIDLFELEGKTLGIIGMGNIAQKVARRAMAFDSIVQYYDKYTPLTPAGEEAFGVKAVSLEDLLRTSDVVTLHVPLTRETRGLIGGEELARMKPTAIIINTSRGGIIEETALVAALRSGLIAGAGLDVLEHEPPSPDDPLPKLDNVIVTPHTAGPTLESIPKRAANSFANIQRVWTGESPQWVAHFENPG